MNTIYKYLIVLLLVFSASDMVAQSNTMDYAFTFDKVTVGGQEINVNSAMIKNDNTMVWNQSNNGASDSTSYTITSASEDWNETNSTGTLHYEMSFETYELDLTILGNTTGITATLVFSENGSEEATYTFNINTISYQ